MRKSAFSDDYRAFLRQLRKVRQSASVTQAELADRLDATQSFISKCERGERRLDVVELRLWCQALRVSFRDFVTEFDRARTKADRKRA